tara:strand:+ start:1110 stop:1775 length:666 start_codon:yes stop_codon:yes gene_type:complete
MPAYKDIQAMSEYRGIFGMGISTNYYLDLLNLSILALAGIMIIYFFQENYSKSGTTGPARTTIWGLGLTTFAVFFMIFISISEKFNPKEEKSSGLFSKIINIILNDSLPILIVFILLIYAIYLNFIYFKKINRNNVSNTFATYSLYSLIFFVIQICISVKYLYNELQYRYKKAPTSKETSITNKSKETTSLIKNISLILGTINFLFIVIMHILLEFFSTDG